MHISLKLLRILALIALANTLVYADEKELQKTIDDQSKIIESTRKALADQGITPVETGQTGIRLSGYVDTSYTYQFASKTNLNGNASPGEANLRQFDTKSDSFNVNALKLALEKPLPDRNELAAGFRADLMFGQDASSFLNSPNNNTANSASTVWLEQAYAQFRVPVGNGLDFKFGKFVSLLGYEAIESVANLNFSRGLLFSNAIPLTHTGALASYKFSDSVDGQLGVVDGWNSDENLVSTNNNHGKAVTGRVNYTFEGKDANIVNAFIYSPDGDANVGAQGHNLFVWDMWAQWVPKDVRSLDGSGNALLLAINTDFGFGAPFNNSSFSSSGTDDGSTFWGVALYQQYHFNRVFSLAFREEYFHSDDGQKLYAYSGSDVVSFTATAGFNLWENLVTRLEYRYDSSEADVINGTDQHEVSVNVVYAF